MRPGFRGTMTVVVVLAAGAVFAGDWPQWMGPNRDGIAPESPALVDGFTDGAPKKVWTSEEIIGGWPGGWGTVAVADGRAYVYSSHNFNVPIAERKLDRRGLGRLGWAPGIPEELSKKVEAARVSEARKALKSGREINPWVNKWMKDNMTAEQRRYRGTVQTRLRAGDAAVPLETLAKLQSIQDKAFPNQEALDAWFTQNGVDDAAKKQIMRVVPTTKRQAKDYLLCLDAATGETKWKKEAPGWPMSYPDSTTPTVAGGRIYLLTSDGYLACHDAATGGQLWKTECPKRRGWSRTRSSSVLVADGLAVVQGEGGILAVDATSGKEMWKNARLGNEGSSPYPLQKDGTSCLVVNGGGKVNLLELKTGKILWSVRGGSDGSAVVADDVIVICLGNKGGLKAFPATTAEPKELWSVPLKDDYTTPVVYQGHVYAVGGAGQGKALCIELKTGKIKWETPVPKDAEYGSPVVADGKLIVVAGKELFLIRATPEKYDLLGKVDLGIEKWTAPTFADGKVFLRTQKTVVCYDLTK